MAKKIVQSDAHPQNTLHGRIEIENGIRLAKDRIGRI